MRKQIKTNLLILIIVFSILTVIRIPVSPVYASSKTVFTENFENWNMNGWTNYSNAEGYPKSY